MRLRVLEDGRRQVEGCTALKDEYVICPFVVITADG